MIKLFIYHSENELDLNIKSNVVFRFMHMSDPKLMDMVYCALQEFINK